MRVSGWSSDVCSADLRVLRRDDPLVDLPLLPAPAAPPPGALRHPRPARRAPRPLWLGRPLRRPRGLMAAPTGAELDAFRLSVRDWCRESIPSGWRAAQTGVSDEEYVQFQKAWFQELRRAGYAGPHSPAAWGGGVSVAAQIVSYQALADPAAPRPVPP